MKSSVAVGFTLLATFLFFHGALANNKAKRQIYREQVLPHSGGKIPEDAFRADRLALNRLNKEGIAVPDGVLLEHRAVHSHPHTNKHDPEDEDSVIRVIQQSEHRYTPEEGRYHNESPQTVASTYIIRRPIGREETNILAPEHQKPLHLTLRHRQQGLAGHPQRPQQYSPPPPAVLYQQHQPQHYQQFESGPSSHRFEVPQQPKYHTQAYHTIPVPFELPNKEIQEEQYYLKQQLQNQQQPIYPTGQEISSRIEWPLLFNNFEKFPNELNSLLSTDYDFQMPFYEPEAISHFSNYGSFYSTFGDRFVRKSQEGYAKGAKKSPKSIEATRRSSGKVKCKTEGSNKCQVF